VARGSKRSASHAGSANANRAALKVEGLRTLRKTLKEAGVGLEDLKAAHAQVAAVVVASALPRVPVDTARLRNSVRGAGQAGAAVVRAGRASVPYAGPIHWGSPSRGIPANPFLWDAIQASRDEWTGLYLHHLQDLIDHIEGAPGP
jgi:hypothetical protein